MSHGYFNVTKLPFFTRVNQEQGQVWTQQSQQKHKGKTLHYNMSTVAPQMFYFLAMQRQTKREATTVSHLIDYHNEQKMYLQLLNLTV